MLKDTKLYEAPFMHPKAILSLHVAKIGQSSYASFNIGSAVI